MLKTSKIYAILKHLEKAKKKNIADPTRSQHIHIHMSSAVAVSKLQNPHRSSAIFF